MSTKQSIHMPLSDLPLWRLLVALDDAERICGPDSPTARTLARTIRERLRQEGSNLPMPGKGGARHAD